MSGPVNQCSVYRLRRDTKETRTRRHRRCGTMPLCDKLRGYEEVDGLLLHRNRIGRHRLVDEPSVDAHGYVDSLLHAHLGGAVGMHALVVEEAPSEEKVNALEQLGGGRRIHHRHVELAIVGHSARCLAIACGAAHANGHHPALDDIGVDSQTHPCNRAAGKRADQKRQERKTCVSQGCGGWCGAGSSHWPHSQG